MTMIAQQTFDLASIVRVNHASTNFNAHAGCKTTAWGQPAIGPNEEVPFQDQ